MKSQRAEWMSGKYGIMVHYLPGFLWREDGRKATPWEAVNSFDLARFMEAFERSGAEWLIFTFGQNTGFYCSPNEVIDRYAGKGHCSERDLMYEIAVELHRRGKRLIAYLPCEVNANTTLHEGFGWTTEEGTSQDLFQTRYLEAVACWARRFGRMLDGWWYDGCYPWPILANSHIRWPEWYAASRAGNPDALVTFNDGCFCVDTCRPIRPDFDYYAGECDMLFEGRPCIHHDLPRAGFRPEGKFLPDSEVLQHALLPIDALWGHGADPKAIWGENAKNFPFPPIDPARMDVMESPIYRDGELARLKDEFLGVGGAVTFNLGIFAEGGLGEATLAQLERLG